MRHLLSALPLAAMMVAAMPVVAQDRDGEDHPALARYPGSSITGYRAPSLDEIVMPTGPIAKEDAETNRRTLTGKVTHIDYQISPATAPLQIERYFAGQLAANKFETVYSCVGPACGHDMSALILNSGKVAPRGLADGLFNDRNRVIVARRGALWVLLHIAEGPDRSVVYEAVVEAE